MSGWWKDYKGRFSLPQFEATLSSQFQSFTYNSVKSQTQLHYRSVFLVAHSCEFFFFFFFHSCTCKEHSTTNHLFSISESVPGEHDLKWVAYSIRMQGESPWTTSTKDKTAVVLTSSSGKSLALSSFSTLNALTHLTSSVYTLFSTLTCLISFLLQGSLFISFCCFKIFKSQF